MKAALDQHAASVSAPPYSNEQQQQLQEANEKSAGYDRIKSNYLRSLNIPVPTKKSDTGEKDESIASSAPIPIPKGQSLSQRLADDSSDDSDDDHNDFTTSAQMRGRRRGNTSPKGVKFVPPHEMAHNSNSTIINHSLPTNYRRRNTHNMGI